MPFLLRLGWCGIAVPSLFHITFTIGVPLFSLLPVWWPVLRAESSEYFRLGATENDFHAIMSRSKQVFVPFPCPYELWVFRVPERDY